ncbi:hypothetical protein CGH11_24775 [Vibrio parahaemolyticus]|nr:hypothetical protein CGH11_24775 [Vibrio parahaemolyticus]
MQLNLNKANKYAQIILVVLIPISILCWFVMLYYTQEIYGMNSKEFKFRAGFLIPTLLSILVIWLMRSKDGESKSLLTLQEKRCIIWALFIFFHASLNFHNWASEKSLFLISLIAIGMALYDFYNLFVQKNKPAKFELDLMCFVSSILIIGQSLNSIS